MLYKLRSTDGTFDRLDPVAFKDFSNFGNLEKDLEELTAASILDVLFEDAVLMPIFQERQYQAEADIYALNEKGELISGRFQNLQVRASFGLAPSRFHIFRGARQRI